MSIQDQFNQPVDWLWRLWITQSSVEGWFKKHRCWLETFKSLRLFQVSRMQCMKCVQCRWSVDETVSILFSHHSAANVLSRQTSPSITAEWGQDENVSTADLHLLHIYRVAGVHHIQENRLQDQTVHRASRSVICTSDQVKWGQSGSKQQKKQEVNTFKWDGWGQAVFLHVFE